MTDEKVPSLTRVALARPKRTLVGRNLMVAALVALAAAFPGARSSAAGSPSMAAVPDAHCGPGSLPETEQGRAPAADFATGRAAHGYLCNTAQVGHSGQAAGLKVFRYADHAGHVCAYYDSTTLFPTDVPANLTKDGTGVVVLDMSNPASRSGQQT